MRNERKDKKERKTRNTREVREQKVFKEEPEKQSKTIPAVIFFGLVVICIATLFCGDNFLAKVQLNALGKCAVLLPFTFLLVAGKLYFDGKYIALSKKLFVYALFVLCSLVTAHVVFVDPGNELVPEFMQLGGGAVGGLLTVTLAKLGGQWGAFAVLALGWLVVIGSLLPLGKIKEWVMDLSSSDDEDMELELHEPDKKGSKNTPVKSRRLSDFIDEPETTSHKFPRREEQKTEHAATISTGSGKKDDKGVMSAYQSKDFGSLTEGIAPENKFVGKFRSIFGNKDKKVYEEEPVKQQIEQDPIQVPDWQKDGLLEKEEPKHVVLVPEIKYDDIDVKPSEPVLHRYTPPDELFPVEPIDFSQNGADSSDAADPGMETAATEAKQDDAAGEAVKQNVEPEAVQNGSHVIRNMYREQQDSTEDNHTQQNAASTGAAVVTGVGAAAMTAATATVTAGMSAGAATIDTAAEAAAAEEAIREARRIMATTGMASPGVAPSNAMNVGGVTGAGSSAGDAAKAAEPVRNITITDSADNIKTDAQVAEELTTQVGEVTYRLPSIEILNPVKRSDAALFEQDVMAQCAVLERTLADFKVKANVVNVTRGPSVTRFELEPAPGVKVASVVNLADDIALRLAANGVRIEAPIPGKSAIGIEAPNTKNDMVCFREVVQDEGVRKAESRLCIGLGKDISGNIISCDIAKMPHMLVAGSTGSGKSVCINTIIAGILYKATPDEVKLILVDPKVVELSNYNGIPHLLTPVVTEPKKAASALHWAVQEMEKRYQMFADQNVRNIDTYNAKAETKMPFIVIIIDELSDLMMVAKVDVEDAILRLAQKARAAGIHLIVATQRPSVDVITGIVKANIPSRIAFAVSSQTDSRTILDMGGAEKLLGKGDMLFKPLGMNNPVRVQGAFVTDDELAAIVDSIKNQSIPVEYTEEVTEQPLSSDSKSAPAEESGASDASSDSYYDDDLFEDALRLVLDVGTASSSMLQRRFRIGYTRAARMVDMMEEYGIVGQSVGSKPREVIMSRQEVEERFLHHDE